MGATSDEWEHAPLTYRVLVALTILCCAACSPTTENVPAPEGAPDTWLVTIDTFRADRAGCMGYPGRLTPSIDRWMRQGWQARLAYAPTPLTAPSHATILTGLEPPTHGVRENGTFRLAEGTTTLASLLQSKGFRTGAAIAAFPVESRFGFAQGFDLFDEELAAPENTVDQYAERSASDVRRAALNWTKTLDRSDRFFLWTHFFDPHYPYVAPRFLTPVGRDAYEREIFLTDLEIHRLGRSLTEQEGRTPVIAILTDHGEALGDHGERSHGILAHEETMRGLFGLWAPDATAESQRLPRGIGNHIVSYSDLLPTLCEVLEVEFPDDVDGVSVFDTNRRDGAYGETYYAMIHYGWSPLLTWRTTDWTYVEGPTPALYDRQTDPGERRNVITSHRGVADALAMELAAMRSDPSEATNPIDEETRARLMALGYVSSESSWEADPTKDPHELIRVANDLYNGINWLARSEPRRALAYLQSAFRGDPENASVNFYLAGALDQLGDALSAMSYYRRAISMNPKIGPAYGSLAQLELATGERERAFQTIEEGLAINPDAFALQMLAGDLFVDVADPDSARSFFERAAELEPRRVEPWVRLAEISTNPQEAERHWEKAVSLDGRHPMIPPHRRTQQ